MEHFARATELDPEYALAWSGLADAFSGSPINADARPLDVWPRARDAAAHAVSSGPDIAESRASQGMVHYWLDWDWPGAKRPTERHWFWIQTTHTRTASLACCSAPPVAMPRRAQRCNAPETSIHSNR